mmetsp:Transcript_15009/g.22486  ORF Transcript_15009/g.22486 Transcript_15009/m.22486 type:complete len:452 (+) Transcript_15009:42-1397(+)
MLRWSPIACLPLQTLTPSGLINLDASDGEVQLISRSSIELRSLSSSPLPKPSRISNDDGLQWVDRDPRLTVTLTSHRIVFQSFDKKNAHFLHHCALKNHLLKGGEWISNRSFKIILETVTHGRLCLIFRVGKVDRDAFGEALKKSLGRKQWEETYRMQMNETQNRRPRKVGVDAILERNKNKHIRAQALANEAFGQDGKKRKGKDERAKEVEKLFSEAKELTAIIHKYVATLEKNQQNSGGEDKGEDTTELTSMMSNMGMITALTKDASSSYHETLARQISDFLQGSKAFSSSKGGSGILTLTDLYCLLNRARGANMISPDDLIESLNMVEKLGLGIRLRKFEGSGIQCVCESTFDDAVMAEKIISFIKEKEVSSKGSTGFLGIGFISSSQGEEKPKLCAGLTVLDAARHLKIPPLLANEQLLSAERCGFLCRDTTLEGTRFYQNHFSLSF